MRSIAILFSAIALTGAGSLLWAGAGGAKTPLEEADHNGDGKINHGEFHQRMVDVFYHLDADKNGNLAPGELSGVSASDFAAADKNGDGVLSLNEYVNDRFKAFDAADRDDNGVLSAEEIADQ